jgi:hypothetical protein
MRVMYILAKQHSAKAVQQVKNERALLGFPLKRWEKIVIADILKYDTPLSIWRKVSGAENTITRFQRVTTMSECMTIFMNEKDGNFCTRLA